MLIRFRKSQSILEYAMLLGIVVAGILIMQSFVKRGFQGGLKDAGDKFGDQYSVSGSQSYEMRQLQANQTVREESGTNATTGTALPAILAARGHTGQAVTGTISRGAYSFSDRSGNTSMTTMAKTDALRNETYTYTGYCATAFDNFQMNNTPAW